MSQTILSPKGGIITNEQISLSTITRCVNRMALINEIKTEVVEMRRYERAHINEVWCGDSSTGLYVTIDGVKKKLWIQALIDVNFSQIPTKNLIVKGNDSVRPYP